MRNARACALALLLALGAAVGLGSSSAMWTESVSAGATIQFHFEDPPPAELEDAVAAEGDTGPNEPVEP